MKENIVKEAFIVYSRDLNEWIIQNLEDINNYLMKICKECGVDWDEIEAIPNPSSFIGDDWDDIVGYLEYEDNLDDPTEVAKKAVVDVFLEEYPECKNKIVTIIRN